jgi:glycosyltransferase involved in cell wall biosynthesis
MLFPSRYEGFGIPVIEAMAAGTPVISSRAAALPEIVGDAGLYVDHIKAEEMLDVLKELDGAADLRSRMLVAGRARAREFTWEKASERLIQAMAARN